MFIHFDVTTTADLNEQIDYAGPQNARPVCEASECENLFILMYSVYL